MGGMSSKNADANADANLRITRHWHRACSPKVFTGWSGLSVDFLTFAVDVLQSLAPGLTMREHASMLDLSVHPILAQ
jgi:hypothetical protein